MASLLRSGKFFRLFSNLTRNFDLNNGSKNESLVRARRGEWEITIHRSLSAAQLPLKNLSDATVQQPLISTDHGVVDRAIEKAESDAKKVGRITKDDILNIIERIKQQKTASTTQSLLLIRCCGSLVPEEPPTSRTNLVQEVWKMLQGYNVSLDISHYNALLRVYLENEHSFNPMKFLQKLEEQNIKPNRVTYQRLLSAYCQKGDIDGASQILEIMKSKDLPIGELVFNSLVMGHANTGDLESARGVIKVMTQAGLEPDSDTYRTLLCGYAKHGLLQEISSTIDECKNKEITLHDRDLLEVLYTAAIHNHPTVVDNMLNLMNKSSGYNQDCFNVILRLVNHQQEDQAFRVLQSMKPVQLADGQMSATGNFFIRQIIKSNCPPEKVISFCQQLVNSGLNNRAFFKALEMSNAFRKPEISNLLLKQIQKQKEMLRPQAFWPLLTAQSKVGGEKGVLDALRQMAAIQVTPNVDTISQRVLPYMENDNVETLLRKLRSAEVPPSVVAISLMVQSLNRQDFASAIDVASKIYLRFDNINFRQAAADAYLKTRDASSLAKLLKSTLRQSQTPGTENDPKDQAAELAGPVLKEVFDRATKPKLEAVEPLLKTMHENGLGVPNSVVQYIQEHAGDEMTESVAQLLVELSSGTLMPTELIAYPSSTNRQNFYKGAQKFVGFAKEHNLTEALNEKKLLESRNFVFSEGLNIVLMDLYAHHGRFDDAFGIFTALYSKNPDIVVTPIKLFNLATSLLKGDRVDDAFKILQRLKPSSETSEQNLRSLEMSGWRLMNVAASKGDVELTRKLFEIIEKSGLKITGMIAGPLIKVHLSRDDIEGALKTFLECVETYRVTPLKSTLTTRLIESEDAQRLQQVMDASIKVHGEMNSLYDLVFAFLECGRVRQAKKVLETPGLRARGPRIDTVCKRYVDEKRITELENLIKITKDVYGVDRNMMYTYLLSACINTKDVARAAGLWTQMQEEDFQPNPEFLQKLGRFLEEQNEPVPFTIPEVLENETVPNASNSIASSLNGKKNPVASKPKKDISESKSSKKGEFLTAIKNGDINAALELKKELESQGDNISVRQKSDLVEVAVKAGRLDVATQLVLELEKSGGYPVPRIFRFYMKALASAGDQQSIRMIGEYLSPERKSLLSYENVLASAIAQDPAATIAYLDTLLNDIKAKSGHTLDEEQLKALRLTFPRGGILGILEKNPNVLPKCQEIASEYVKLGVYGPVNSLWCYYLNSGNLTEAQSTWETLKASPIAIGFQPVCRHIRQHQDVALAETLINMLVSGASVKPSALAIAYSAWIDVHRSKNELDEAIATLNKALSGGVELSLLNESTLSALKTDCEKVGKSFPYSIPKPSEKPVTQPQSE